VVKVLNKRDIHDMGTASDNLMNLRPVTFRYKQDPDAIKQYGLVAEEVAKVYPELVTYGANGKVETVRYLELTSMLLNELQKQTRQNQRQAAQIQHLTEQGEQQVAQNRRLSARIEQQAEQMAQLKGMFEQAMAAQKRTHVAAAFNR
jgi:hypothetical protein